MFAGELDAQGIDPVSEQAVSSEGINRIVLGDYKDDVMLSTRDLEIRELERLGVDLPIVTEGKQLPNCEGFTLLWFRMVASVLGKLLEFGQMLPVWGVVTPNSIELRPRDTH